MAADGSVAVSVRVKNTGKRAGEEVVQLYVHEAKSKIDRPVRELKGFSKVALNPGETKTVSFNLTPRDLAYFDVTGHQWKADGGKYEVEIGASSRDIRLTAPLQLQQAFVDFPVHEVTPNTLTAQEQADGWKLLWDGKTTGRVAQSQVRVRSLKKAGAYRNGTLSVVFQRGNAESQAGGDIAHRKRYANFELVADFED